MKSDRKIQIAFLLNLTFSIFEFFGGLFTGSIAILSDALHDLGDAIGIGISFLLEKKSKRPADSSYTLGYGRFSVIGSLLSTSLLLFGSVVVIWNAVIRILNPVEIDYTSMIVFAVVGVLVNLLATFFTHKGSSLNQKAVNLHMLEDVLGWLVVLVGAVVMKFTSFTLLDPLLSIGVAIFILVHALHHLKEALDVMLEKVPEGLSVAEIASFVSGIEGVLSVHDVRLWSLDGEKHCATMCVVVDSVGCRDFMQIKYDIREKLLAYGVVYMAVEMDG